MSQGRHSRYTHEHEEMRSRFPSSSSQPRSQSSRGGGLGAQSVGVPLVSPMREEAVEDAAPPSGSRGASSALLEMEDEVSGLPSHDLDLVATPDSVAMQIQEEKPKKVKKVKKLKKTHQEDGTPVSEAVPPQNPSPEATVPKKTAPSHVAADVLKSEASAERGTSETDAHPQPSHRPAGHKREGRVQPDATAIAAESPTAPPASAVVVADLGPTKRKAVAKKANQPLAVNAETVAGRGKPAPKNSTLLNNSDTPIPILSDRQISDLTRVESGTMREFTTDTFIDKGGNSPLDGAQSGGSVRIGGDEEDRELSDHQGTYLEEATSPAGPDMATAPTAVFPPTSPPLAGASSMILGRPPTSPSAMAPNNGLAGTMSMSPHPGRPPPGPSGVMVPPPVGAMVNGQPMPVLVPRDHLLLYFPKGIFGLHNHMTREPISLDPHTGDLHLAAGQHYCLPSAGGSSGMSPSPPVAAMPSAFGEVYMGQSASQIRGPSTQVAMVNGGNSRAGPPVQSRGSTPLENDTGGGMRRERSTGGRSVGSKTRHTRTNSSRKTEGGRSQHGGSTRGGDKENKDDDKSSDEGILPNLGLFKKVKDIDAPDDGGDPALRLRWLEERKKALLVSLVGTVLCTGTMIFATIWDEWLSCECTSLGFWNSCVECIRYVPFNVSSTQEVTHSFPPTCVPSETATECQNPNWAQIIPLEIIIDIFIGIYAIINFVDVVWQVTPRRPFYALFSLCIWSMMTALWSHFLNGASTPVIGSETRVECAMRSSFDQHLNPGSLPLNSKEEPAYPTQENCKMGWSYYVALGSWILWTLVMAWYFYMRWRSWSKWGKKNLAKEDVMGTQTASPRGGSRQGSFSGRSTSMPEDDYEFDTQPPIPGGTARPVRPSHRRTDSNSSQVMARLASDTILSLAE